MSAFVEKVRALILAGNVRISEHGYDKLAEDGLSAREVLGGVPEAILVEEYPEFPKGPCALFLQKDRMEASVHVVWGIPKGHGPWCWLRPIVRIWHGGRKRLRGGRNDEAA